MPVRSDLTTETKLLEESWKHIEKDDLKTYLVRGFQNPRINIQSILTRHFLIEKLFGQEFDDLMQREIGFSIEINKSLQAEEKHLGVGFGLGSKKKIEDAKVMISEVEKRISEDRLNAFQKKWREALSKASADKISVIEPACGSANDYRFLHSYGIARFLNYKGFDIAEPNIENARQMFPEVRFEAGNVLDINESDKSFDYLIAHDLFEHLSPAALEVAMKEVCRIARKGMILTFFNMLDIPEHKIHPLRKYHWNQLSAKKITEFFKSVCKKVRVIRITEMLAENYGYCDYYNGRAYTLIITK